ncbi:MAG: hypothetical protein MK074_09105, partial [Phycisphaerales bacterium]|nr:hypothetical protein [Phycisphaerales bacterium]
MHLLGIDIGTGGARAVILNLDTGDVAATGEAPVTLHHPEAGWSEQHPEAWWSAATAAVQAALAAAALQGEDIAAIGLTGQMHGCTLVDASHSPVRPAILWNDQRTAPQCESLLETLDDATWRSLAGKPPLTGLTLPSLCWVREHEPEVFAKATGLLLPKDFIRLRLTGTRATDVGDASGTLLLDLSTRTWSSTICSALDVDPDLLPAVHEGTAITGTVTAEAAAVTGLKAGTPVVAGGGDQQTGGIGCGITETGAVSLNLGTSGVVFAAGDHVPTDLPKGLHGF